MHTQRWRGLLSRIVTAPLCNFPLAVRRATVLLLLAVGCYPTQASGQVVSTIFDGVQTPIRVEFWSAADGAFDWYAPSERRATDTWTAQEIQAVERGVGYWWEVLGAENTPGRELTFRMIRSGEEYNSNTGTWSKSSTHSSSAQLIAGGYYRNSTNNVWAFGNNQPPSQVVDSIINYASDETGYERNGPLQPVPGVNLEITTIHELGHTLGIAGASGVWGDAGVLGLYESQIVFYDDDGDIQPIVAGESIGQYDRFYFNGPHARSIYGDTVYGADGRPVPLATESGQKSHLGINPFTMTHESFRNYPFFSEVELGILQDLGYQIDRSRFFGRSIYTDGQPGDAPLENHIGFNSTSTYGVGLHVKAHQRTVIQQADINAAGIAGNGIRVDGNNNHLTVNEGVTVRANNEYGIGLLISNGRFNDVVHRGTIQANSTAEGVAAGTGIMIGFGYDTMGPDDGDNRTSATPSPYSGGYLVNQLDITGEISAGGNAIHLDHTAAVFEINLMSGAALMGNIRSDAIVGTDYHFARPTITFGRLADANGVALDDVDPHFALDYQGNIGGQTLMDARFHGGREHASGTSFSGGASFHHVEISEQGRVTVAGALTAAEGIEIAGALHNVNGNIASQETIVIVNGGELSGTGVIVAPEVDNQHGGTITVGNPLGSLIVAGNVSSAGTIRYGITNEAYPTDAGLLRVTGGTVVVDGGTFQAQTNNPLASPEDYEIGRRYTIIQTDAPGSLQIKERPISEDDLQQRRMILRTDTDLAGFYTSGAQSYFAYVGRDVAYATFGETANQRAVGHYLDQLTTLHDGTPLSDQVQWFRDSLDLVGDDASVQYVLNQMSGDLYASLGPMLVQESYLMQYRLASRLRAHEARLQWCDEEDNPQGHMGGWIAGFGTGGSTSSDGNAAGYNYSSGTTQAVVTYSLSCDTTLGGYYNYTGGGFSAGWAGTATTETNEFGLLLSHHAGPGHFLIIAGGGAIDMKTNRAFAFGNTDIQAAVYNFSEAELSGTLANVYGEYGIALENGPLICRPFLGFGYVLYSQDRVAEQGTGLGTLTVNGNSIDSFRSLLGIDAGLQLREQHNLRVDARAAWMHDFSNDGGATVISSFSGIPGAGFAVQGLALGRDFAMIGTSLSRNLINDNLRTFVGYDLFANDRQVLNSGNIGLEMLW